MGAIPARGGHSHLVDKAQLAKGERKESYLIDLAADEDGPKDVLRQKIQAIRDERARIRRQLEQTTNQLEAGRQVFTTALTLLNNPHGMYQAGNETVRSILNRALFPRLYIAGRTYRTSGSVAVMDELAAIRNQPALPAGFDTAQAAHSAGLSREPGAVSDPHIAATWKNASRSWPWFIRARVGVAM